MHDRDERNYENGREQQFLMRQFVIINTSPTQFDINSNEELIKIGNIFESD